MRVWFVDGFMTAPEAVECEVFGYPNPDAAGRMMFKNSHFKDPADAWAWLERDVAAHNDMLASRIEQTRKQLREHEQSAADVVVRTAAIREAKEKYERECLRSQSRMSNGGDGNL